MRRAILLGIFIGLGLLLVADALAARLGLVSGAMPSVAGPFAWITSRAGGIAAFLALTLDLVFGLLLSTGRADRLISRAQSLEVHRWLGSATLALMAVHVLALTADRIVRLDLLDALVPFLSSYRPLAVGLGVLAAYGAITVQLSFSFRRHIGVKTWRKLHALSFLVFAGAIAHGVLAGTDSGSPAVQIMYGIAAVLVLGLSWERILRTGRRWSSKPAS